MCKRNQFFRSQLKYFLQSLLKRESLWHISNIPKEACVLSRNFLRHCKELGCEPAIFNGPQRCHVVILSHNRPQNIDLVVRSALKNSFVTKLIVSNSNPEVCIAEWVNLEDDRLVLIDERKPTQPGHRFVIARNFPSEYTLAVDDDIFLTPTQWRMFFQKLIDDPSVPHGITGNQFVSDALDSEEMPFEHVTNEDCEVDVLIGAYAFTSQQVTKTYDLCHRLGFPDLSLVRNGEDIMLSFSGDGKPRIHDLGRLFTCTTSSLEGIALWKTHGDFWMERARLFERAKKEMNS